MGATAAVQMLLIVAIFCGLGAFIVRKMGAANRALRAQERERATALLAEVEHSRALASARRPDQPSAQGVLPQVPVADGSLVAPVLEKEVSQDSSEAGFPTGFGVQGQPKVQGDLGDFFVGQVKNKQPLFTEAAKAAAAPITFAPTRSFDGAFGQAVFDLAEALRNAAVLVENAGLRGGGTYSERAARVVGAVTQATGGLPVREVVSAAAAEDAFGVAGGTGGSAPQATT